ncbi:MAG: hypothetical protein R3C59_11330 [Planctomycetaceae bacterium]
MFFLDLKRADVAIESGRLDDAFELLRSSSERGHRDGQRLIDRLADALLLRTAQHLADGRLEDARQDGNKLMQLAGRKPNVAALLQQIADAEQAQRDRAQYRNDRLASVDEQVKAGAYTIGAKLLGPPSSDDSAGAAAAKARVIELIDAKRMVVADATDRIRTAVDAGQFDVAINIIVGLKPDQRAHTAINKLLPFVIEPLVKRGRSELASGRLDRAVATLRLLQPLSTVSAAIDELQQCLSRCRTIREHLAAGRYPDAETELVLLSQVAGNIDWITATRETLTAAIGHLNSVLSGPLGLLTAQSPAQNFHEAPGVPTAPSSEVVEHKHSTSNILQVDTLGSLLLLTNDVVTIGASTRTSSIDVALMTEGDSGPITVRRVGDDYFAESKAAFSVNGQRVTRRLLASGDTLAVGARGRLRFVKPVAASSSAILQVTGSRLARRDIRSVVLMADSLLFGPHGSHFRLPSVEVPIVLYRDRSGYALRQLGSQDAWTLRAGESVVQNDVRFGLVEA